LIPYSQQKIAEQVLRNSQIIKKEFLNEGSNITANLSPDELAEYSSFITK
jgi:hypothetical protein